MRVGGWGVLLRAMTVTVRHWSIEGSSPCAYDDIVIQVDSPFTANVDSTFEGRDWCHQVTLLFCTVEFMRTEVGPWVTGGNVWRPLPVRHDFRLPARLWC